MSSYRITILYVMNKRVVITDNPFLICYKDYFFKSSGFLPKMLFKREESYFALRS